MPLPTTGAISMSDIARIVYNNSTAGITLNDSDVRTLLGVASGAISMSSAFGKPTAGSANYGPGTYTFYVPAYENLSATVAAGGGGGGGGGGGQLVCCPFCANYCCSGSGSSGGNSSFNGLSSTAGTGGAGCGSNADGTAGGNNQNANKGGGGAGGTRGGAPGGTNCNQTSGGLGGAGGICSASWRKAVNGPAYGAALTVTVGGGGPGGGGDSCGTGGQRAPGGAGGNGYVSISWS